MTTRWPAAVVVRDPGMTSGVEAILLRLTGLPSVTLAHDESGRPYIREASEWSISLSRSGPSLAVAASPWGTIGIDYEVIRPIDRAGDIAERWIGDLIVPAEEPARSRKFLAEWAVREALLKATGLPLEAVCRPWDEIQSYHVNFPTDEKQRWRTRLIFLSGPEAVLAGSWATPSASVTRPSCAASGSSGSTLDPLIHLLESGASV